MNISRKRLTILLLIAFILLVALCFRTAWLQIVKSEELSKMASVQQTRDLNVTAKRGAIYDINGEMLAASLTRYAVWLRSGSVTNNAGIKDRDEYAAKIAKTVADAADCRSEDVLNEIDFDKYLVRIARSLTGEQADKIREAELTGIELAEEPVRYYIQGTSLAHTLGGVNDDGNGLFGLELQYNDYLSGISGRAVRVTDGGGNLLTGGTKRDNQVSDGYGLMLTVDEVIQAHVETAIAKTKKKTSSDKVSAIVMNTKTGDILAMAQTPGFDLNNPRVPLLKSERAKLDKMSETKKGEYWSSMWRNSLITDLYEPGSTLKLLTTAMALEEGISNVNETFYCNGFKKIGNETLKCWSYQKPHGTQTLKEAVGNSCNPVFMELSLRIGARKSYEYLETFGVTQKTGIDFPGEAESIIAKNVGNVDLAARGYGHGVAITPIQLITAVSSFGNGGKMMKPRLVKALLDSDGNVIEEIKPEIIRYTVSQKTAQEVCDIMEYAVDKGGVGTAKVKGYRIGGKTGTAQQPKKDGSGYSNKTWSSFIGMAPMEDPEIAVLVITDNPKGVRYGSQTAAPCGRLIFTEILRYLEF